MISHVAESYVMVCCCYNVEGVQWLSSDEDASATGLSDSLLSSLGEELSLHDDWYLWECTLSEHLEEALHPHTLRMRQRSILTALVTSITAALSLLACAFNLVCSDTSDQRLSTFTVGVNCWFLWRRKCLIPRFPKYPGWLYKEQYVIANVKWVRYVTPGWDTPQSKSHTSSQYRCSAKYLLFVHVDPHVMHTTGKTSTTRMLPVLSNSTVSVWNVSSQLSSLSQSCNLSHK